MIDWEHVVRTHGPLVWQTAWRLLGHESDAADCFQETFVSALEAARTQQVRDWPAFLIKLATARSIDRLRRRARENTRLEACPEFDNVISRQATAAEIAEERELAHRLRQALAQLPDQQAEVFCLAALEALPHADIAAQLGLTANHVGVLLHRARAALRTMLSAPNASFLLPQESVP
jgi:RNA polymerase sigma-70 factor (ECF subfamily)